MIMKLNKNAVSGLSLMVLGAMSWNIGCHYLNVDKPAFAAASATTPVTPDTAYIPSSINIFANLAKQVMPAVVNISTVSTVRTAYQSGGLPGGFGSPEDFFQQFFGGQGFPGMQPGQQQRHLHMPAQKTMALGSGFIVDPSGIILTNNHVVENADEIKIQFTENSDEEPTPGRVIARDPDLDVALIKVKTSRKLTALALGDSDAVNVGEYVMAVGNPYGQGHSVTHGIVSAKGRIVPGLPIANYLQVDAPINPGNSGGPLLNLRGEVIGINNAIDARAQGIGFAIPINFVKKVLVQLETNGKVSRGYIGAVVAPLTPEIADKIGDSKDLHAPMVTEILPGSPAEKAGLQPYDAIVAVGETPIHSPGELVMAIGSTPVGKAVPLKILRNGKSETLSIQTKEKPGDKSLADSRGHADEGKSSPENSALQTAGLAVAPHDGHGVVVTGVEPGSAAAQAGISQGDVILEADRKEVKDAQALSAILKDPNKSYLLRVEKTTPAGDSLYAVTVLDMKNARDNG
jgi:serine protease Do